MDLIDMKGSIVSMDAIYCQKDICRQLIDKKADYVLSLKKNHATLYDDVSLYLDTQIKKQAVEVKEEIEKGHGRIEIRRYALSPHIDWLESKEDWIGLKAIGMVESIREINGKQEKQLRYYLTSLTDLTKFSETARDTAILNLTFHPVFGLAGGIGSKLCSMNAISASQPQSTDS
ncbi:MAG: ISAs1 family transposase [Moraxellaceae bacterium]|nr:ISAs1 family transposase [Moraxellaceae bacterium]